MAEVYSIDLSRQDIADIPLNKIRNDINWLILSDNRIKSVPKEIKNLKNLTRLALNDNRIERVDKEIGSVGTLSWLDLTRNRLKDLPIEMGQLTRITGLGLSENEFEAIPECVYKLKNLRKFGFFSNRIMRISPEIKNLRNLVKVDLSNNNLEAIPEELCTLINISWLNLSNNKLKCIPPQINKLTKLEELGLGMNEIEELPDMSALKKLRILPVFKNKLKKIHPSLLELKTIEKLDFSDNFISEFPFFALKNPTLRYLNLRNNKIEHISSFEFGDDLSGINMLDLSENLLKYLPYKLFKSFKETTTIRLGSNPYEHHPSVIPSQQSLMNICFTKILNKRGKIDPWISNIFKKQISCDYCKCSFVVEALLYYDYSYLDTDCQFVLEKTLCSVRCLRMLEQQQ